MRQPPTSTPESLPSSEHTPSLIDFYGIGIEDDHLDKILPQIISGRKLLKAKQEYMDLRLKTHLQRWHVAAQLLELKQEMQSDFKFFEHNVTDQDYINKADKVAMDILRKISEYAERMRKISLRVQEIINEVIRADAALASSTETDEEKLKASYGVLSPKGAEEYVEKLKKAEDEFAVSVDESLALNKIIRDRYAAIGVIWQSNYNEFMKAVMAYDEHPEKQKECYEKEIKKYAAEAKKYKKVTARVIKNDKNAILQAKLRTLKDSTQEYLQKTTPSLWDKTGKIKIIEKDKEKWLNVPKKPNTHDFVKFLSDFLTLIRMESVVDKSERNMGKGMAYVETSERMFEQLYQELGLHVDAKEYNILSFIPQETLAEVAVQRFQSVTGLENTSFADISKKRKEEQDKEKEKDKKEEKSREQVSKAKERSMKEAEGSVPLSIIISRLELFSQYIKDQADKLFTKERACLSNIHKNLQDVMSELSKKAIEAEQIEAKSIVSQSSYTSKKGELATEATKQRRTGIIKAAAKKLNGVFAAAVSPQGSESYTTTQPLETLQASATQWRQYALTLSKLDDQWRSVVTSLQEPASISMEDLSKIVKILPDSKEQAEFPSVGSGTAVEPDRSQVISSLAILQNVCKPLESPPAVQIFQLKVKEITQKWRQEAEQIEKNIKHLSAVQKAQEDKPQLLDDILQEMDKRADSMLVYSGVTKTSLDHLKSSLTAWSERNSLKDSKAKTTANKLLTQLTSLQEDTKSTAGKCIEDLNTARSGFYAEIVNIFRTNQEKTTAALLTKSEFSKKIQRFETLLTSLDETGKDSKLGKVDTSKQVISSVIKLLEEINPKFKETETYKQQYNKIAEDPEKIIFLRKLIEKIKSNIIDYQKEIIDPIEGLAGFHKKLMEKDYSDVIFSRTLESKDIDTLDPTVTKNSPTIVLQKNVTSEGRHFYYAYFIEDSAFITEEKDKYKVDIELTQEEDSFITTQKVNEIINTAPGKNNLLKQIIQKAILKRSVGQEKKYSITETSRDYVELLTCYQKIYAGTSTFDGVSDVLQTLMSASLGVQQEVFQLLLLVYQGGGAITFRSSLFKEILSCEGKSLIEKRFILRKAVSQQIIEIARIQQEKVNAAGDFLSAVLGVSVQEQSEKTTAMSGDAVLTHLRVSAKRIDEFNYELEETEICSEATVAVSKTTQAKPMSYLDYRRTPMALQAAVEEKNQLVRKIQTTAGDLEIKVDPSASVTEQVTGLTMGINVKIAAKLPHLTQPATIPLTPVSVPAEVKAELKAEILVDTNETLEDVIQDICPPELEPNLITAVGSLLSAVEIPEPREIVQSRMAPPPLETISPQPTQELPSSTSVVTLLVQNPGSSNFPRDFQEVVGGLAQGAKKLKSLIENKLTPSLPAPDPISVTTVSALQLASVTAAASEEKEAIPETAEALLPKIKETLEILEHHKSKEKEAADEAPGGPDDVRVKKSDDEIEAEARRQMAKTMFIIHGEKNIEEYIKILVTFPVEEFEKVWSSDVLNNVRTEWRERLLSAIAGAEMESAKRTALEALVNKPLSAPPRSVTPPAIDALPAMCPWKLEEKEIFSDGEYISTRNPDSILKEIKYSVDTIYSFHSQIEVLRAKYEEYKSIADRTSKEDDINDYTLIEKQIILIMGKIKDEFECHISPHIEKLVNLSMTDFLQLWSDKAFDGQRSVWQPYLLSAIEAHVKDSTKREALKFLVNTACHRDISGDSFLQIEMPKHLKNAIWPVGFIALKAASGSQSFEEVQYNENWKKMLEEVKDDSPTGNKARKNMRKKQKRKGKVVIIEASSRAEFSTRTDARPLNGQEKLQAVISKSEQESAKSGGKNGGSIASTVAIFFSTKKEDKSKDKEKQKDWDIIDPKALPKLAPTPMKKGASSKNLIILRQLSKYYKINVMIKRNGDSFFDKLNRKKYKNSIHIYLDSRGEYHPLIPVEMLKGDGITKILLFMKAVKSLSAPVEDKLTQQPSGQMPPRRSSIEGTLQVLTGSSFFKTSTTTATITTTTTSSSTTASTVTTESPGS